MHRSAPCAKEKSSVYLFHLWLNCAAKIITCFRFARYIVTTIESYSRTWDPELTSLVPLFHTKWILCSRHFPYIIPVLQGAVLGLEGFLWRGLSLVQVNGTHLHFHSCPWQILLPSLLFLFFIFNHTSCFCTFKTQTFHSVFLVWNEETTKVKTGLEKSWKWKAEVGWETVGFAAHPSVSAISSFTVSENLHVTLIHFSVWMHTYTCENSLWRAAGLCSRFSIPNRVKRKYLNALFTKCFWPVSVWTFRLFA